MTAGDSSKPLTVGQIAPALPVVAGASAFLILFREPLLGTVRLWWTDPESAHGLLLFPVAIYLAWRAGRVPGAKRQPFWGAGLLIAAVLLRWAGGLAAEQYTMRFSMLLAAAALVVWLRGWKQLRRWWLPAGLLVLSLPLPELIISGLSLPLQMRASRLGAGLLAWRHVPVSLSGNVIGLPGQSLFVTEACSGLRSLTALLAIGLLVGGLWLHTTWARVVLVVIAIPVAMLLNGVRIFATGFAVQFISPELGEGVMHYTEGWVMFVAALAVLAGVAWLLASVERWRDDDSAA